MDSDDWAVSRMVELRQAGEPARFRIQWVDRGGKRLYRVEIQRVDGVIERPLYPLPLGTKSAVMESTKAEMEQALADGAEWPTHVDIPTAWGVPGFAVEVRFLQEVLAAAGYELVRNYSLARREAARRAVPSEAVPPPARRDQECSAPAPRTFEQAWARMQARGYQYGSDALEQVRMGWELATAPERLLREESEQRQLEQRLDAIAPAPGCAYSGSFCGDTSCPVHGVASPLDELAPGSLRTFADQLTWVAHHAAEIGDPDVAELAARALDGDEQARDEALAFWRLWKGLDEATDVP